MRPEFKGNLTQAAIHQLYEKREARHKKKERNSRRKEVEHTIQKAPRGEICFSCGAKPVHPRSQWPATQSVFKKCGKEGHYGSRSVCKSKRGGNVNELQTQPIDAPSNEDSIAEDYTQVYFTAAVHYLKTVMAKTLNHSHSQPHIRPLWVIKELDLITGFQISCRVDTNASCNILPHYKGKSIFGTDLKLGQPTMNLNGYINNDISVESLGSCCVYLHYGKQTYKVSCVTDSKDCMILARHQALLMVNVSFPEIQQPAVKAKWIRT